MSIPPLLAARRAHIRSVLHEPNAVPGLATRLLTRSADAVALLFDDTRDGLPGHPRVEVTGYPIRAAVAAVLKDRAGLAAEAARAFDLDPARSTVLVFGGSQGAQHLNEVLNGGAALLADRDDLQLLILTGPAHADAVAGTIRGDGLRVRSMPFLDRMELAYAIADLVVSRAGATTIAELAACGLPSLLVPYPHATEHHQEANARELQRVGAAEVILDAALTPTVFAERVAAAIADQPRLAMMAEAARRWAKPDAAGRFAKLVVEVGAG